MKFAFILCFLILFYLLPNGAFATEDSWTGPDKAMHAGFSAAIAGGGYAIGAYAFEDRGYALLVGAGLALSVGAAKEMLDWAGLGQPSIKDLAWNAIGTLVGLALAYGLDVLVRGTPPDGPPLMMRDRPLVVPSGVVFRF